VDEEEEQRPRGLIEANGEGKATHLRRMRREWDTQTVHAVEIRSKTWCASCASGGGENKERRGGSAQRGRRAGGRVTKRRKKGEGNRGVRYRDEARESRADKRVGERGAYSARDEASAAPCHDHVSAAHMGPTTDGVRRACSDSDPPSVARSLSTVATSHQCPENSRLQEG
jgi:hypothetical protein